MSFWRAFFFCVALALVVACAPQPEGQTDEQKDFFFQSGTRLVKERDFKGAVTAFEKALELNPRSVLAHYELGLLYETRMNEPAIALYHYKQVLRLQPNGQPAEIVQARTKGCEQEIAKNVSLSQVDPTMMAELERLREENRRLQRDVEAMKSLAASRGSTASNAPDLNSSRGTSIEHGSDGLNDVMLADPVRPVSAGGSSNNNNASSPAPVSRTATVGSGSNSGRARSSRVHFVKSRETFSAIARQYGLSMAALRAANPTINPERLRIGQSITIPASP